MRKIKFDMTVYGIKRILNCGRNVTIILFFQCILYFFLISVLFFNTFGTIQTSDTFNELLGDKLYYTLSDKADEDGSFENYMSTDDGYAKLKGFMEELKNTENITFISAMKQPVYLINSTLAEKFKYGYEEGNASPDVTTEDKKRLSDIKSLNVSENAFSEYGINTESGRSFSHDDFIFERSQPVSVILGSEYKEYYQIGDIIEANNVFEDLQLEIIGFFAQDTPMPVKGQLIYLDRYVVMPYFSEIEFESNKRFAKFSLANMANGDIITKDKNRNVQELVNTLSEKYDTFDFEVRAANTDNINMISQLNAAIIRQMTILTLVLIFFSVVGISATVAGRLRERRYEYGVHLMSGAALTDIMYQVAGAVLLIVVGSAVLSCIVSLFVTGMWGKHILLTLLVSFAVAFISSIGPVVTVMKMDVSTLIKRKE